MSPPPVCAPPCPRVGPLLGRLFDSLNRSGVRWLVLRGRDRLEAPDGDVDLLVHPADLSTVSSLATEVGFVGRSAWGRRPHRFMSGYDPEVDRMIELDLVDEIAFGPHHELRTETATGVLARAVPSDGVPVPCPEDAVWLNLIHLLLDKTTVPIHRIDTAEVPGSTGPVAELLPASVRRRITTAMRAGDPEAVRGLGPDVADALGGGAGPSVRRFWRRSLRTTVKLQKATVRRGPSLALLGPDGAGKSTLVAALARSCRPEPHIEYMGVYPRSRRPVRLPGVGLVTTVGRLWTAQARAAVARRRGRPVIFDRHPLEAAHVGPPTSGRGRLRRRVLSHTVPRPDHVVVLDAPVEELLRRKPEHSPDRTAEMRESYLRLAGSVGARVVDTTEGPEATRRALLTELFTSGRTRVPR
ncbi:MAG TPA: ATP-binding cassette domain-containing protein [Acidimicrobiales bacterium]|nr:ATP-binding cassette domain-containing protein [Acidimicrobiales bacterium]